MLGIKCRVPNTGVIMARRDETLVSVGAGDNVVRLLPPLNFSVDEGNELVARLAALIVDFLAS